MLKAIIACGAFAIAMPTLAQMPAPSTPDYMMKAGQSDQFEIQSGQLAQSNGASSRVKSMGAQMVKDHTKSTQLVMAAAMKSGLPATPPPPLDADQQSMMSDLQSKQGADFDSAYIADQTAAHQKALSLHQSYADQGSDPNFRGAARKIVPVVKMHITMLQQMSS